MLKVEVPRNAYLVLLKEGKPYNFSLLVSKSNRILLIRVFLEC